MWGSRRTWAWSSALAWTAVLAFVPPSQIRSPTPSAPELLTPLEAVTAGVGPDAEGLVYIDRIYNTATGDVDSCGWGYPWRTTMATGGRIRPLFGLYRETSAAAEFLTAETGLRVGAINESGRSRPHWFRAWQDAGSPSLDTPARAEALGARWYAECDAGDNVTVSELSGVTASGVTVTPYPDEETWHRVAVEWWMSAVLATRMCQSCCLETATPRPTPARRPLGACRFRLAGQPYCPSRGSGLGVAAHPVGSRLAFPEQHPGCKGRTRPPRCVGGAGRNRVALVVRGPWTRPPPPSPVPRCWP